MATLFTMPFGNASDNQVSQFLFHILLVRQDNPPGFPHLLAEEIINKCLLCFLKASYVNLSLQKLTNQVPQVKIFLT